MTEKNQNNEGIHVYGDYIQGDKTETNYIGCQFVKNEAGGVVNVTNHNAQEVKDDDLEKEQALIESNRVLFFRLHGHKIVFVRLYEFIADNFVTYISSKNAWCVLKRFLIDKELLSEPVSNKTFAEQMNDENWFGWVEDDKKCSEKALQVYDKLSFCPKLSEMEFNHDRNNPNATYTRYCEMRIMYERLADEWDDNQIVKKQ